MKVLIPALNDKTDNYIKACEFMEIDAVVSDSLCEPDSFDGLILPGGSDLNPRLYGEENLGSIEICDDRDKLQLETLDRFVNSGKPVFGTCRGLQLINVYFGGTLLQDIKGHRIENEGLHPVSICKDSPYFEALGEKISVNSTHHQCIDKSGDGLKIFAISEDNVIEGVYHAEKRVFAVQWHPERLIGKGGEAVYEIVKKMFE